MVLVKSLACGICGSDLHARKHAHRMVELAKHFPGRKPMDLSRDVVFGHEFCCEVLDYGPGTTGKLKPGTKVCSLPALLTAEGPQGIGYSNDNIGAYAERMLLSEALLLEVPNGLAAEHAALTEPLAVGVHAVAKANIKGGEVPLVIGCGPVGLAVIAALKIKGMHPIVAADYSPARRALAEKLGADVVVDPARSQPYATWAEHAADVAGGKSRAPAAAGIVAGAEARADLRMRRRSRPDPAGVRRRAARRAHRRGRRLHGNRPRRADARHPEGTQRSIRAGLHAGGIRLFAAPDRGRAGRCGRRW